MRNFKKLFFLAVLFVFAISILAEQGYAQNYASFKMQIIKQTIYMMDYINNVGLKWVKEYGCGRLYLQETEKLLQKHNHSTLTDQEFFSFCLWREWLLTKEYLLFETSTMDDSGNRLLEADEMHLGEEALWVKHFKSMVLRILNLDDCPSVFLNGPISKMGENLIEILLFYLDLDYESSLKELLELVLQNKATDPNIKNSVIPYYNPPLIVAVVNNRLRSAKLFIELCQKHNIKINLDQQSGWQGNTSLMLCLAKGKTDDEMSYLEFAKFMLESGAKPNLKCGNYSPMYVAILRRDIPAVKLLLGYSDKSTKIVDMVEQEAIEELLKMDYETSKKKCGFIVCPDRDPQFETIFSQYHNLSSFGPEDCCLFPDQHSFEQGTMELRKLLGENQSSATSSSSTSSGISDEQVKKTSSLLSTSSSSNSSSVLSLGGSNTLISSALSSSSSGCSSSSNFD